MAKKTAQLRVHQLADELGVTSKDIVAKCVAEDIPNITNHMSALSAGLAATIREWFGTGGGSVATAVESSAPVDVSSARAKATRRPARKLANEVSQSAPVDQTADVTPAPAPRVAASVSDEPPVIERPAHRAPPHKESHEDDGGAALAPAAKAPVAPSAPAKSEPKPVMNVPERPKAIKPAGPMLQAPTKTKLSGPKVIRVEQPDVVSAPKSAARRPDGPSVGRGGPRGGRGAGFMPPSDAPGAGRGDQGIAARRNKRRTAGASEEAGRVGRAFPTTETNFDWREQDLKEREQRLARSGGFFKAHRRDNLKKTSGSHVRAITAASGGGKVKIAEPISIKSLSAASGVKSADLVKALFLAGKPVTINSIIDAATAQELMIPHNIELEVTELVTAEQQVTKQFTSRQVKEGRSRSPVITILGHVDHGKTSLLDKIRNTNVAAGEAGGITQKTSAFQVPVHAGDKDHLITFIDTPGHEAFTEMRARGAKVTDIVVLVVAADDGVMPQTVESINHAKAAGVPIIVALNKIDKAEATDSNIQRILGQLAQHQLNPVEWGGTTEVVRTSATKGTGIQELLEILDYQAELRDLQADFAGQAEGWVLEARQEEGRGPVANILIQQGTLRKGDFVVLGRAFGRVRDIINDRGERLDEASPAMPVAISGVDEMPDAGDKFYVTTSLKAAEAAAQERRDQERQKSLAKERVTLDNIFKKLSEAGIKELPLIVKADVQGSVDTLQVVLSRISTDQVKVSVKHAAVGGINESDVLLAEAAKAIIVGFNVTASNKARREADSRGVDIRLYDVIYDITDDVTKAAEGLLEPEHKLEVLGHADVRAVFKISRVGMIAGCYCTDGVIERNAQIRVTRGGIVVEKDRRLEQLKRFKDDVKEVRAGQECGMKIDGYDDIKEGDVLECYKTTVVRRSLATA